MIPRPTPTEIHAVIDATWPAAQIVETGGWCVRDGAGGGGRVSSATAEDVHLDYAAMEAAHLAFGQTARVMVREGEDELDQHLAKRDYEIADRVALMALSSADLADPPPEPVRAFTVEWPVLQIQRELWEAGGHIGPERLAVMQRARCSKATILGRASDQPAGAAFLGVSQKIAMLHALEVLSTVRRQKTAVYMMRAAARWALDEGADWITLCVSTDNAPAMGLYASLGFAPVGYYHYRVKQPA